MDFYGDKTTQWLSDLTHQEDPWKNVRTHHGNGSPGADQISLAAMEEYYTSL